MKYSKAQLRQMANHLLKVKGSVKYSQFILMMVMYTGKDQQFIESKIYQYAGA